MKYIIDRFEGEFAVIELENSKSVNIPKVVLPVGAKEGDIINITIEKVDSEQRAKRIEDKLQNLFKRGMND